VAQFEIFVPRQTFGSSLWHIPLSENNIVQTMSNHESTAIQLSRAASFITLEAEIINI
jgi:hypothetical protein